MALLLQAVAGSNSEEHHQSLLLRFDSEETKGSVGGSATKVTGGGAHRGCFAKRTRAAEQFFVKGVELSPWASNGDLVA